MEKESQAAQHNPTSPQPVEPMNEDYGLVVQPYKANDDPHVVRKLDALNDSVAILRHKLGYQISSPNCYVYYEVDVVGVQEVLVTFHCSGELCYVGSVSVSTSRPVSEVHRLTATLNGMWPSAARILKQQAGLEDVALSQSRPILHFKLEPPPAIKGGRKPGDDTRDVYLCFGASHLGHVVDVRPLAGQPGRTSLKVTCHRFGDWTHIGKLLGTDSTT
ncbi:hypothetical protein DIPPA_25614 [Diplonema papillatum]|nr:hypothetical protein DIPPA_25614 [Diplonema papillatum]